ESLGDLDLAAKAVERRRVAHERLVWALEHHLVAARVLGQEDVAEGAVADRLDDPEAVELAPREDAHAWDRRPAGHVKNRRQPWGWAAASPALTTRRATTVALSSPPRSTALPTSSAQAAS